MLKIGGKNMGYFSNFIVDYDEDNSYPSSNRQLIWRLEELQIRLEELKENGEPRRYKETWYHPQRIFHIRQDKLQERPAVAGGHRAP